MAIKKAAKRVKRSVAKRSKRSGNVVKRSGDVVKRSVKKVKAKKDKSKQKAWANFSLYIRLRDCDANGDVTCVTCGRKGYYKGDGFQAGHFIDSRSNNILLDEELVHVQCTGCNMFLKGNKVKYSIYMLNKGYTKDDIEEMHSRKFIVKRMTPIDWQEQSEYYKEEYKKIAKKKGIKL